MRLTRIIVLLILVTISSELVCGQSDLKIKMQFLNPILSKTNIEGKKYCTNHDSIVSFNESAFKGNGPTALWLDLNSVRPIVSVLYTKGQLTELRVHQIVDTIGLYNFCDTNNIKYCGLFKATKSSWSDHKYSEWNIHLKLATKNDKTRQKCLIETWDSTTYYIEVLKNPIYIYYYGIGCYESGEPPLGRYAIYYLQRKNLVTSIANLKDFTNNEGLMYIAEYFVRNKIKLPEEFDKVQNKKFEYCDGCTEFGSTTIKKMINEIKEGSSMFSGYFMDNNW